MDFITWWFDVHYIWSTILMPVFSFIWGIYMDNPTRMVVSAIVAVFYIALIRT